MITAEPAMKKIKPIIKTVDTWNNQRKMPFDGNMAFGIGEFSPSVDDEGLVEVAAVHMKWLGGIVYTSAKSVGATGWLQIPTNGKFQIGWHDWRHENFREFSAAGCAHFTPSHNCEWMDGELVVSVI